MTTYKMTDMREKYSIVRSAIEECETLGLVYIDTDYQLKKIFLDDMYGCLFQHKTTREIITLRNMQISFRRDLARQNARYRRPISSRRWEAICCK